MNRISMRRAIVPAASVAALALALSACGGNNNDGGPTAESDAVLPAPSTSMVRAPSARCPRSTAELFNETNPEVQVTVGESGTGGGFEVLLRRRDGHE